MIGRILTAEHEELLRRERQTLTDLAALLERCEATPEDLRTLSRSALQLDELFLLVVAGEFNAGKSAFVNALVGANLLAEGVTPTTTHIQLLRHGAQPGRAAAAAAGSALAVDVVTAPVELLREIHIVDTPGTNAIHREHEAITREFVPRSDLVLFVTSADRPFTESERAFLQGIRDWGKKVVVVINKIDILDDAEVEQVRAFVAEHALALLGAAPDIFPVSARLAQRAKADGDAALLAASRFAALERFVSATLDQTERLRLKLLNPLGIGSRLAQQSSQAVAARAANLQDDVTTLDDIESQLDLYREDMVREFRFRLADVAGVLQEFENRGMAFFDDTLRLGRVFDLLNKARIKAEFEAKAVADVPQVVARRVQEVIDWLVTSDLRQWQAVIAHVEQRRQQHSERIVGQVGGAFELDRTRLLDSVGRAAQQAIEHYDRDGEATRLAASLQGAVASTALVEMGAIGLGALVAHVLVGAAADVTGVLAAGVVATLGLFIIPSRREAAKRELRTKIAALRSQLIDALTQQFEREVERSLRRIADAVAPYTRFVRAEQTRLAALGTELDQLTAQLAALTRQVKAL